MINEFEKLPYIADKLESIYYCENIECYTEKPNYKFCSISTYVNGALYAYQEQQKKIGAIKIKLNSIYDACDDNTTVAILLDEIEVILK